MAPSSRTARTIDSRGNASSVILIHWMRSGNFDRRLYRGAWLPISRSSTTSACSWVRQGTASTPVASRTISSIRERFSAAVK